MIEEGHPQREAMTRDGSSIGSCFWQGTHSVMGALKMVMYAVILLLKSIIYSVYLALMILCFGMRITIKRCARRAIRGRRQGKCLDENGKSNL